MSAGLASTRAIQSVEDAQKAVEAASEQSKAEAERALKEAIARKQEAMETALKQAEEYLAEKQKFLKDGQEHCDVADTAVEKSSQSDVTANWMFGDAGKKTFGFAWAHNNPMRWSGVQPFDKAVADMKETEAQEVRPICMIAPGDSKEQKQYENQKAAVDHLYELCPKHKANKERLEEADTAKIEADAPMDTLKWCVTEAERTVAKAKHDLDPS